MPAEASSRLRRSSRLPLAILLAAVLVLVPAVGVASAATYPPQPEIDVDKPVVVEGTIVTISGSGFKPNSVVCLCILSGPAGFAQAVSSTLGGVTTQDQEAEAIATCLALGGTVIGLVTTDENGDWEFQWDTAEFPPGDYVIAATDGETTLTIEVDVTDPTPPTTLPTTTTTEPGPTTTTPGPTTTEAPPVPTTAAPGPGPGPGPSPTVVPVKPLGPSLPQTGGIDHQLLRLGAITLAIGALTLLAVRSRRPTRPAS